MANRSIVRTPQLGASVRLDSEYYQSQYLSFVADLGSWPCRTLASLGEVWDGVHSSPEFQPGSGLRYIFAKSVRNCLFNLAAAPELSPAFHARHRRTELQSGDLLISIGETIGYSAVVHHDMLPANFARHVGLVRFRDVGDDPHYVAAYLNSRHGRALTLREASGDVQMNLFLYSLRKIRIPYVLDFVEKGDLIRRAHDHWKASERQYREATASFMDMLVSGVQVGGRVIAYSSQLAQLVRSRRWDPDFHNARYMSGLATLKHNGGDLIIGFVPVSRTIASIASGHTPLRHDLSIGEVPFLTADHVSAYRIDFGTDRRITLAQHLTELSRTQLRKGDVLLTIKGRIGNAAVVEDPPPQCNINQDVALVRLRPDVDPYVFAAWFNSPSGRAVVQQYATGSVNPILGLNAVKMMPFPLLRSTVSAELANRVRTIVSDARRNEVVATRLIEETEESIDDILTGRKV